MRVLWVFERICSQLQRVAWQLVTRANVELEIMCRLYDQAALEQGGIQVTPIECRSKFDFRARRRIREKLNSGNYDLVHAYTSRNLANVIGACRGLRPMPKIIGYRGTISRLRRLDPANWITFWHPCVSKITCVCEATNQALRDSGILASKLATVWEGCDAASLVELQGCSRSKFGIPADAFVVGTVANMRRAKGIHLLLEAARSELADLTDVYWLLIGEVIDPEIRKLACDPVIGSRVRLAGPIPQGGRFVGLFDVYAAPSLMEGLSMSIMEAMAKRVCPLVSRVGGNVELIRNERDGLVVPPRDASALASAIRRLHAEPELRHRLATSAQQRMLNEFSISEWTSRLVRVYQAVASHTKSHAA